jgi:hypothetical protein
MTISVPITGVGGKGERKGRGEDGVVALFRWSTGAREVSRRLEAVAWPRMGGGGGCLRKKTSTVEMGCVGPPYWAQRPTATRLTRASWEHLSLAHVGGHL